MKTFTALALIVLGYVLAVGSLNGVKGQRDDTIYDEDVKLVSFEDLPYPALAKSGRVQGTVVVKVTLGAGGEVVSASAVSGPRYLIPDAVSNAKKWRFRPNAQRGAVIVYDFSLDEGGCHDNSHSLFRLLHSNLASIMTCTPVL